MENYIQGESIAPLLSVLDVLTGDLAAYKTVSAVALEESIIIKLGCPTFFSIVFNQVNFPNFDDFPILIDSPNFVDLPNFVDFSIFECQI